MSVPDPKPSAALRGAGGGGRSGLLDVVRLFASLDIVAFHTGNQLGNRNAFRIGVGMAIFLLMNAVSVATFRGERPFLPLAAARARRYLTPFAFWCVVYALLNVALALRHQRPAFGWVEPRMIWAGTFYHLWFMPVALGLSLAVEGLRRRTLGVSSAVLVGGVALAAPLLLYAGPGALRPLATRFWYPWVWIVPAVPMGVAFGRLLGRPRTPHNRTALVAFAVVFLVSGIWLTQELGDTYPLRYGVGAALIAAGFAVPLPSSPFLVRLRTLSAGIFLCHPLVLRLLLRFVSDLPVPVVTAAVWVLSAGLTLALAATPLARFVGDPPELRPSPRPGSARIHP